MGRFDPLIFSLSPLSEIFEGQISPLGIHKGFLEKVAKYGKTEEGGVKLICIKATACSFFFHMIEHQL